MTTDGKSLPCSKEKRGPYGTSNRYHLSMSRFDITLGAARGVIGRKLLLLSICDTSSTYNIG